MIIGYARVSTKDQVLDLQIDALKAAGCEKVLSDKLSGAKADRPGLTMALEFLREGDTLVVWKLDRLGRSIKNLLEIAETLGQKKIGLQSLTDNIDTSSPLGRFFFHLMAALSEMERSLTKERIQAGLEAARRRGRVGGRPRKMTTRKIEAAELLLKEGVPIREVAEELGVGLSTLYEWKKKTKERA